MVDGVRPPRRAARQGLQVMDICRGQHGRGHRRHPQGAERVHRARGLRPPVPQVGEKIAHRSEPATTAATMTRKDETCYSGSNTQLNHSGTDVFFA